MKNRPVWAKNDFECFGCNSLQKTADQSDGQKKNSTAMDKQSRHRGESQRTQCET